MLELYQTIYKDQVADVHVLQKRIKNNPLPWNEEMARVVQSIKQKVRAIQSNEQKVHNLPSLTLPMEELLFILETNASNEVWATSLLQQHTHKEEVCSYALGSFKDHELKYASPREEILALKNGIKRFRIFLMPIHFTVRTVLQHMKSILQNKILLEQGNNMFPI